MKRYYKWFWDEPLGGEFDAWGTSTYFFEIRDDFYATRQIEVYENGNVLFYDEIHVWDEYGMLCDQPLGHEEMQEYEITKAEFELVWSTKIPINR